MSSCADVLAQVSRHNKALNPATSWADVAILTVLYSISPAAAAVSQLAPIMISTMGPAAPSCPPAVGRPLELQQLPQPKDSTAVFVMLLPG